MACQSNSIFLKTDFEKKRSNDFESQLIDMAAVQCRKLWVGGNTSKERDRKSELVLRSTYQIFE